MKRLLLTAEEIRYLKFTRIGRGLMGNSKRKLPWRVFLEVGNQSFRLDCEPDSKDEAHWHQAMLAKALSRVTP